MNLQAGTVLGDLPPYETFNLGGPNSVRGYDGGDIGSGRTYVLASQNIASPFLFWMRWAVSYLLILPLI